MIEKDEFFNKINTDGRNIDRLEEAYDFGKKKHNGQKRKFSQDPYYIHPVRVAISLSREEDDLIIAGLLHDVMEDTNTTREEIEDKFGPRVEMLVQGMTKNDNNDMFDALSAVIDNDPDVLKIKLADRIDNMTDNFDKMPEKTKKRYIDENPKLIEMADEHGITDFVDKLKDLTQDLQD